VGSSPLFDLNSVSGWVETIQSGNIEDFIEPVLAEVIPIIDEENLIPPIIEIIDEIEEVSGVDIIPGDSDLIDTISDEFF
jgi:hypothetical protein